MDGSHCRRRYGNNESFLVPRTNMLGEEEGSRSIFLKPTSSLPGELLFNILLLLPPDFLYEKARFVCHKWCKIIQSQAFINTQIHRSTYGLLITSRCDNRIPPVYVTVTQGQIQTTELSYTCRANLLASCNGLAVETLDETSEALSLHLINPTTKQSFLLPSVSTDNRHVFDILCGIAYSAASMEYKVILPYMLRVPRREASLQHVGLVILTVGVEKSWRDIEVDPLPEHVKSLLSQSPLTTEGFIHWGRGKDVLTLNVETEIFTYSQLPLPPPQYYNCHYLSTGKFLSVLVEIFISREEFSWEIWEMKADSGEWRKLLSRTMERLPQQQFPSRHYNFQLDPLGWVIYPQILAFRYKGSGRTCIFYNLDTHEVKTIEFPESYESLRAFAHRNNLVWLT